MAKEHSADTSVQSKLLTVGVSGRNDNYQGNFKYRLATCINYLARHLKNLGRLNDVEIVVTDWNSDIPLAKVLPLLPEAGEICRFVYVPPIVARSLNTPGEVFHGAYAANVAIRRGQGEFIMVANADTLIPRRSLHALFELLDGKLAIPFKLDQCYFLCGRQFVSWDVAQREPSLEDWDRYLLLSGGRYPYEDPLYTGLGGNRAALMMHRSLWHACHGLNEQLSGYGWTDIELYLRITQSYPWMELSNIGVSIYEIQNLSNKCRVAPIGKINSPCVTPVFEVNDENWGLNGYNLEIQTAGNIRESPKTTNHLEQAELVIPWKKSRQELLAELTGEPVRKHIRNIARTWNDYPEEWVSLYALTWYSMYHYPCSYIEFGVRDGYAATLVTSVSPGVNFYGIDSWQEVDTMPIRMPDHLAAMLHTVGYNGYMRLVTGEFRTAFHRLQKSVIGPLSLDLALIRGDMLGKDALQQMANLVSHFAPGAALVFTCSSQALFQTVWSELRMMFPQFTYFECKATNTGVALAASLKSDSSDGLSEIEEAVLARVWKPVKPNRLITLLSRLLRSGAVILDKLQSEPIRRWPEILRLFLTKRQRRQ